MLKFSSILIFFFFNAYSANKIIYYDPLPGAEYVSPDNNIVLGFENPLPLSSIDFTKHITINGSLSGALNYSSILTGEGKKIILKPHNAFKFGEKIAVRIVGLAGNSKIEYAFDVSQKRIDWDPEEYYSARIAPEYYGPLPPPNLVVRVNNNPAPGSIFIAPWYQNTNMVIANNSGVTQWFLSANGFCGDFKKQPNGNITYFDAALKKFIELDNSYQFVKYYACGNGYTTDIHELRVLANGNALLMAYDPQQVNMGEIIPGGHPQATVIGLIIQEIDVNANVVFQWRSWDHFQITDATHEELTDSLIDYVHGNAIDLDNDGNLLISSRNMDEITKINRATGNIIWRFGGKNNQFTLLGDTIWFSHQHAIRRIPNGNVTLFDNGNYNTPQESRAVEYALNEVNKTAAVVWQYRNNPPILGLWGGFAQRLSNGNTFISWGGTRPTVTEVTPSGIIVFEGSYPYPYFTYRAFKYEWNYGHTYISGENAQIPSSFKLYQNYPNPFNPSTAISYDIASASEVELVIYDVTGSLIQSRKLGYTQPGSYSVTIDGSNFASGLYFYTLKAGSFTSTLKMILVK